MFWNNLIAECQRQGIKVTPLLHSIGISPGNVNYWKKGGNVYSNVLLEIARKLGVTTDYLLTGNRTAVSDALTCITDKEESMLKMYRAMSPYQKSKCLAYIQGMYDACHETESSEMR